MEEAVASCRQLHPASRIACLHWRTCTAAAHSWAGQAAAREVGVAVTGVACAAADSARGAVANLDALASAAGLVRSAVAARASTQRCAHGW